MYGFRLVHLSFNVITVRKLNPRLMNSARKWTGWATWAAFGAIMAVGFGLEFRNRKVCGSCYRLR